MTHRVVLVWLAVAAALSAALPVWAAPWLQGQQQGALTFPEAPAYATLPFFSQTALKEQRDSSGQPYRLGNSSVPLWDQGCAVAALAMVYRYHGADTDLPRLNDALRQTGAFSGALIDWSNQNALIDAGAPWIMGVERINTNQPADYQERINAALDRAEPVIVFLNREHYVVLTGREEKDGQSTYYINDPWASTAGAGQGIALEDNLLQKGGFQNIRQIVFVTPEDFAPTNGILVDPALSPTYVAFLGAAGSLGNPLAEARAFSVGMGGLWQEFEHGAIIAAQGAEPVVLFGPIWDKFRADGGLDMFGTPLTSIYSELIGQDVVWRADFGFSSIGWAESEEPQSAHILDSTNAYLAEYFDNPDLTGDPVLRRYEQDLLFDWQEGAPAPWMPPDGFSARFTGAMQVGGLGWRYNFVAAGDSGVRLWIDDEKVLDTWSALEPGAKTTRNLGRGWHDIRLEYRHDQGDAWLQYGFSDWPAVPVFAAENTVGTAERVPASVAQYVSDMEVSAVPAATQAPPVATAASPLPAAAATPTAAPATSLIGRWELAQGGGDCFGYLEPDTIEFFADELYTARPLEAQPFGGAYSLLDDGRIRFELPQTVGGGLSVCEYAFDGNALQLIGPYGALSAYVPYQALPAESYPAAIVGQWQRGSYGNSGCLAAFDAATYGAPEQLTFLPGREFRAAGGAAVYVYGAYSVLNGGVFLDPVRNPPTPTPPATGGGGSAQESKDLALQLWSFMDDLSNPGNEAPAPFTGDGAYCEIERLTHGRLALGDDMGNQVIYRRTLSGDDVRRQIEAEATHQAQAEAEATAMAASQATAWAEAEATAATQAVVEATATAEAQARWTTYTTADGLASDEVYAIAQAADGSMWFGTNNGVSRLNSQGQWTTFTTADGLASDVVPAIIESADGALWFGTWSGVSRLDSQGRWTTYTTADGLADDYVYAIAQAADGGLWFGTGGSVSWLNPQEKWTIYTEADGIAFSYVTSIAQSADGALWFGFYGGLSQRDMQGHWTTFREANGLAEDYVQAIIQSTDGALWFGTWGGGVSRLDSQGHWTTFTTADNLAANSVNTIIQSADGALWFGTWGGVNRLDAEGRWTTFTTDDGLADNFVNAIAQSADGALWLGTGRGVSRYDPMIDLSH
jgi:hypothetical protein